MNRWFSAEEIISVLQTNLPTFGCKILEESPHEDLHLRKFLHLVLQILEDLVRQKIPRNGDLWVGPLPPPTEVRIALREHLTTSIPVDFKLQVQEDLEKFKSTSSYFVFTLYMSNFAFRKSIKTLNIGIWLGEIFNKNHRWFVSTHFCGIQSITSFQKAGLSSSSDYVHQTFKLNHLPKKTFKLKWK